MAESAQYSKPQYGEVQYAQGSIASIEGKFHLKLAGVGFLLTRDVPSGRHNYARDQAPTFVSKFGSGEPAYRDSSFFGHFAQINWRNGNKQDDWDDEGRFLTSKNINVTTESEFKLSSLLTDLSLSAGAGVDVTCFAIDYSDSRKVFAGTSNGHVWRYASGSWTDMGDVAAVGGGAAGRRVNCLLFSKIGGNGARAAGSGQIYAGVGTPGAGGTGSLYRYDGTWALANTFTGYDSVLKLIEFAGTGTNSVYASLGGTGVIQSTAASNLASAWTTSKDIDYPGYMYAMAVFNNRLYVGGGSPENAPTSYHLGTLWTFDGFTWSEVQPFEGDVIRSMCVYDNLLFFGTILGKLYVYNRANIDLLFEAPDGTAIFDMTVYKDQLHFVTNYRTATNAEEAVYTFDRAGVSRAYYTSSILPLCLIVNGDDLFIGGRTNGNAYKIDPTQYVATGELQGSYFNANLPSIDKIWFDLNLEMKSLPASTKIQCYYKFDDSDSSWTFIDQTETAGAKIAVFSFPEGTSSKKLSYRIVLTTTNPSNTPTVKKVIVRYINQPDFRYLWRLKVACPDNVEWLDGTSPISPLASAIVSGDNTITLVDSSGFPNPNGETMYAVVENLSTGAVDEFTYTGIKANTLTGVEGIDSHTPASDFIVAIRGRHFHNKLLELKQRKAIISYVDIDTVVYRCLLSDYTEDSWIVYPTSDLENEVSLTILQA